MACWLIYCVEGILCNIQQTNKETKQSKNLSFYAEMSMKIAYTSDKTGNKLSMQRVEMWKSK